MDHLTLATIVVSLTVSLTQGYCSVTKTNCRSTVHVAVHMYILKINIMYYTIVIFYSKFGQVGVFKVCHDDMPCIGKK